MERNYLPVGTKIRLRNNPNNKEDSLPKEWEGSVGVVVSITPHTGYAYQIRREGTRSNDGVYYEEVVPLRLTSKRLETKAIRFLNIRPVWENIS